MGWRGRGPCAGSSCCRGEGGIQARHMHSLSKAAWAVCFGCRPAPPPPPPLDHADMAECLEELTRRFRACAAAGLPGGDAWQYAEAGRAEHKAGAGEAAEAMLSTADLAERLRELIAA